jgi:hypothetical protein
MHPSVIFSYTIYEKYIEKNLMLKMARPEQ